MPNAGVVSMVVSSVARRRNLLLCAFRSPSSVVQTGPKLGRTAARRCRSDKHRSALANRLLLGFQLFELGIDGFGVGALEYRVDLGA